MIQEDSLKYQYKSLCKLQSLTSTDFQVFPYDKIHQGKTDEGLQDLTQYSIANYML